MRCSISWRAIRAANDRDRSSRPDRGAPVNRKKAASSAAPKLYRSIREVSLELEVKPHVLRYWETQFPSLRPKKNRAGNRMYRPEEVKLLTRIKELLYAQRFTIEGA